MLPILQIGPLSLQTSGLVLLIGMWVGLSLSERFSKSLGSHPEEISNLAFYSLLAALLGARLSYALRFPSAFSESPASLLSLNPGLLDPWGAIAGAILIALVYGQRKGLLLGPSLDALTPAFATLAVAVTLSNLASGQGYGLPTDLPWSIDLWGASRHPSQIYEAIGATTIIVFLLLQRTQVKRAAGTFFLEFLALGAGSRLFFEAFRGDGVLLPNGWRTSQLLAWLALAASLYFLQRLNEKATA